MNVSHVVYAPLLGGPAHGHFVLEVVVAPSGHPLPASDLSRNLETWAIENALRQPTIHLDFSGEQPEDEEVWELIGLLRDKGFFVRVTTDGQHRPPWFEITDYRVVQVGNEPWSCHGVNEVRYLPPIGEKLIEPDCGIANEKAMRYVEAQRKIPGDEILHFVQNAKYPWGIIVPPIRQYQLLLMGGEK